MNLRTITVDDEPVARRRLARILADVPDVEIVAECEDGLGAVQAVRRYAPDLLFLDVQMPGMNGFEVLQSLEGIRMPVVVFVTAFDEFAVQAFDVQALDYLLKPFGEQRVEQALDRARACIRESVTRATHLVQIAELLEQAKRRTSPGCLFIKRDDRVLVLQPAEISWIESDGDYVRIHTTSETHFIRMKLAEVERRLVPEGFVRIHRSRIVNLSHVKEFRPLSRGLSIVMMKNGTRLDASYAYLRQMQDDPTTGT